MKVTKFMEQNDASEANISKLVKKLPRTSQTHLKLPATCPYSEPDDPRLRPPKPFQQYPF
jgi:hypothetical protein